MESKWWKNPPLEVPAARSTWSTEVAPKPFSITRCWAASRIRSRLTAPSFGIPPCIRPNGLLQTDQSVCFMRRSTMAPTGNLSWLSAGGYVSDGGLETDLIFNRGIDLPEFASFPLVEDDRGRALLRDYYDGYAAVARRAGAGLTLESPTWRANPDWGARVGYDTAALASVNRAA